MLEPGLEIAFWVWNRCASVKLHCGSNVTFSVGKSLAMMLSLKIGCLIEKRDFGESMNGSCDCYHVSLERYL